MKTVDIIASQFPASQQELILGGVTAHDLAERFGTPLFVYDESVLERAWQRLRSAFPSRFDIFYSVKANPNLNILAFFLAKGAGLEIASAGELHQALEAGCGPEHIVFAGPGKSVAELELAIKTGIAEIHAESGLEIERIAVLGQKLNRRVAVALRVNAGADSEGGAMRMGGKPTPFGIDEEQLDDVLQLVRSSPSLELQGIHLFSGTQILDSEILLAQYRKGLEIARRVAQHIRRPLRSLDFGGGLGIPYFPNEQPLDMVRLAAGLRALELKIENDSFFEGTRFLIEPGRYLVAEAGVYLTRVLDIKVSRGKKFVVVDGGMNHHLAASGNLGQTIKRNFPLAIADKWNEPGHEPVDIVGPLCTPLDTLARALVLPTLEVGDLVAIFQSGAYARSASPLGFLSHLTPPEVMVEGGHARLIRRRGAVSDCTRDIEFAGALSASAQADS